MVNGRTLRTGGPRRGAALARREELNMLRRRTFVSGLGRAAVAAASIWCASNAGAQRATQPIARPPGRRPGGPLGPGRFAWQGGVASGALPGLYVVVGVDAKGDALQLRDADGRIQGKVNSRQSGASLPAATPSYILRKSSAVGGADALAITPSTITSTTLSSRAALSAHVDSKDTAHSTAKADHPRVIQCRGSWRIGCTLPAARRPA
jgi:hypothetical protein